MANASTPAGEQTTVNFSRYLATDSTPLPNCSRAKLEPNIRDPVNTSLVVVKRKLRSADEFTRLEYYSTNATTRETRIMILHIKYYAYMKRNENKEEKGGGGFDLGIKYNFIRAEKGGRRIWIQGRLKEVGFGWHSTTHRATKMSGEGSYVAGESCLTCCRRCCCCVCGRCGLTNRSTAVADAEPPPPMIPVANRGPRFESILATSRDSRFSSFKKADVDMCQSLLFRPNSHQPSAVVSTISNTSQHGFEIFFTLLLSPLEKYLFTAFSSFIRSFSFKNRNFRTVFIEFWLFLREKERNIGLVPFFDFRIVMVIFVGGKCASGEKRSSREIIRNMCARRRNEKKLLIKARESFLMVCEFCLIFYRERGKRFFLSSVWGQDSHVFSIKIYT